MAGMPKRDGAMVEMKARRRKADERLPKSSASGVERNRIQFIFITNGYGRIESCRYAFFQRLP